MNMFLEKFSELATRVGAVGISYVPYQSQSSDSENVFVAVAEWLAKIILLKISTSGEQKLISYNRDENVFPVMENGKVLRLITMQIPETKVELCESNP